MSYTRRLPTQYITVHYSRSVSYPASQHGGTLQVSGSVSEPVDVVVHVDTDLFDHEIDKCNDRVNLLTGSVVATEGAQVESIHANSRKVGDTIIRGFFKTVRSDISQQIAALQSRIDALLIHLHELSARCIGKRDQMTVDYNRISSRYLKIFGELDRELENRIHAVDAPVFDVTRAADATASATTAESLVATTALGAAESSRLHARISAAMAKRRASEALSKAQRFLNVQYSVDSLLADCLRPGGEGAMLYTPVCLSETTEAPGQFSRRLDASPLLDNVSRQALLDGMDDCPWGGTVSPSDAQAIAGYFNDEVARMSSQAVTPSQRRVAAMTSRLFNLSSTASPGI